MTLDDLAELSREAGREIYRIWTAGFTTETKVDGSLVTIADQRAEAIILAGLALLEPNTPVIAEEEVAAGRTPSFANRFFLVDPLDGTKGFSENRKGEFTVNIGLIENNRPIAGVIYAPASGALYAGGDGVAWRSSCDLETAAEIGPREMIRVADTRNAFRLVGSATYGGPKFRSFATSVGASATTQASSSMKFCQVATGEADIYPRFGGLCEWDVAAGHAILAAAGGGLMRLDGTVLRYGRADEGFTLDGLVAFGGSAAEKAAREALD